MSNKSRVTAFLHGRQIAEGGPKRVGLIILAKHAPDRGAVIAFDETAGHVVDICGGSRMDGAAPRKPGRPAARLRSRDIALTPQHWEWLSTQRGGAAATLRRLVDDARKGSPENPERRDAAYRFMQAACANQPNYEAALKAVYRARMDDFDRLSAAWPDDLRDYVHRLIAHDGSLTPRGAKRP